MKELYPDLWEDTIFELLRTRPDDPKDFQTALQQARQNQSCGRLNNCNSRRRSLLDIHNLSPRQEELLAERATKMGIQKEEVIAMLNRQCMRRNGNEKAKTNDENGTSHKPQFATLDRAKHSAQGLQSTEADSHSKTDSSESVFGTRQLDEALPNKTACAEESDATSHDL